MAIEKTDGIVLRRIEYSNTSLIVSLYTRRHGKLEIIAKGARRDKSPFHGVLDLANHVQVVYYRHTHGALHTLSECSLLDDFPGLRENIFRFYAASNVLELISSLTAVDDRNVEMFELMLGGLSALNAVPRPDIALLIFHTDLLRVLGYLPVFFKCASCGKDVLSGEKAFFSPLKGGVLCGRCGRQSRDGFSVAGALIRKLHDLSEISPGDAENTDVTQGQCKQLTVILMKYFTFLLEREPRTARCILKFRDSLLFSRKHLSHKP